jgi:hypothetical protein
LTVPHLDPKPLEPWALELLRQEHAGDDPLATQELARLVTLLRALPDPERSPDLSRRILEHVAAYESRPRVVRVLFGAARRASSPGVAAILAAGIAALFAVALAPDSIPSVLRIGTGTDLENSGPGRYPATHPARRHPVLVRPQVVSAAVFAQAPAPVVPRIRPEWAPLDEIDAYLDHQLNQLMIDPTAFAERLERVDQRDRFIARLAERAAERGDAAEIALRVRESPHPLTTQIVDRLLRATLVAQVSPH